MADHIKEKSAAPVSLKMLQTIIENQTKEDELNVLVRSLGAIAKNLDVAHATTLTEKILEAAEKGSHELNLGFSAVSSHLEAASATKMADSIMTSLSLIQSVDQLSAIMEITSGVMQNAELDDNRARQWIEFCKYPFAPKDAIADAVRRSNRDAPPKEKGFWVFIDWANRKYSLDLTSSVPFSPPLPTGDLGK